MLNLSREVLRCSRDLKLRNQFNIRLKVEKNKNVCSQMAAPSLHLLIQERNELSTLTAERIEYRLGAPHKSLSNFKVWHPRCVLTLWRRNFLLNFSTPCI